MDSCAWMNGQYQDFGPPSQSSQAAVNLTHGPTRNHQTENNQRQYGAPNTGVQLHQRTSLTSCGGARSNRQLLNHQPTTAPHQAAGRRTNDYNQLSYGNSQISTAHQQRENPAFLFHVANHQNSDQHASTQIRPPALQSNATCSRKDVSAQWNQYFTMQNNLQHDRIQRGSPQSGSRALNRPILANSSSPQQVLHTARNNTQKLSNRVYRQNNTQHGFPPHNAPPYYKTASSQSYRDNRTTSNPSSGPTVGQKAQQFSTQVSHASNTREGATSSDSNRRHYEAIHYLRKTNKPPMNPAARHEMNPRPAGGLCTSFPARSDAHSIFNCSGNSGKQSMTQSHQTLEPLTSSDVESCDWNASQTLSFLAGQPPQTSKQSLISGTLTNVDETSRQTSRPNNIPATGDGSGHSTKADDASLPISKGNKLEKNRYPPQLLQLLLHLSPQMTESQLLLTNVNDRPETIASVKPNESSINSSPGRSATRMVAVVQPLSQESCQSPAKNTSSTRINQETDCTAVGETPGKAHQDRSNQSVSTHTAACSRGSVVSSSDAARPQNSPQNIVSADDTGSKPAFNVQSYKGVAPAAQQLSTPAGSVSGQKSQNGDDDRRHVSKLSSLITIPWTADKLFKVIQFAERAQLNSENIPKFELSLKLLSMYWDNSCKVMLSKLKTGWYRKLIPDVNKFCSNLTADSVLLSEVINQEQLRNFHVLKDNDVYSEPPYTSSWLNINERLDDIDKEFGFPLCLIAHPNLERDQQPDRDPTADKAPAQVEREESKDALQRSELEPVDPEDEKQDSTVEITSTQTAVPNKTDVEDSNDPYYSFDIQVLPPEEARLIFEQADGIVLQTPEEACNDPEEATNTSVEVELIELPDITSYLKVENGTESPMEEVCCIAKWMEINLGSNEDFNKCQCKKEQSDVANVPVGEDEKAEQEDSKQSEMGPDSALEGEDQETLFNPIPTFCWAKLCNDGPINEFNDEDFNQPSLDCSQSSITFISQSKDEDLSSSENVISNQWPELVEDLDQAQLTSAGSSQSSPVHCSNTEISNVPAGESEDANQFPALGEDFELVLSPDSPPEPEQQMQVDKTVSLSCTKESAEGKLKRRSSDDTYPVLKLKKYKHVSESVVDSSVAGCEPAAPHAQTVELVLFGSASHSRCVLFGGRKSHRSSLKTLSDEVPNPPEVLSVKVSPHKTECKLKPPKSTPPPLPPRPRGRPRKADRSGTSNKVLTVSPDLNIFDRLAKRFPSLKTRRKKSHSNMVKPRDSVGVALKQPADQNRRSSLPVQDTNVLKFSVLPKTFSFTDGLKETKDHVSNKPELESQDKRPNRPFNKTTGSWYSNPGKQNCPLRKPAAPKKSNLFEEFRNKYKKRTPTTEK